jgi:hypothetical protein
MDKKTDRQTGRSSPSGPVTTSDAVHTPPCLQVPDSNLNEFYLSLLSIFVSLFYQSPRKIWHKNLKIYSDRFLSVPQISQSLGWSFLHSTKYRAKERLKFINKETNVTFSLCLDCICPIRSTYWCRMLFRTSAWNFTVTFWLVWLTAR